MRTRVPEPADSAAPLRQDTVSTCILHAVLQLQLETGHKQDIYSLLAKYTMHFCTNSECMACRLKYMGVKGWGLVALHAVKAGSFVVEYIGGCHHLQHARTPYVLALT